METPQEQCEIGLTLRYAFWEYPAVRGQIDDAFSNDGWLRGMLESPCTEGIGERLTSHQFWVCSGHLLLLPASDRLVSTEGAAPLSVALEDE